MGRAHVIGLLAMGLALVADDAGAVIGMPATPVSVAGAARRTTRRAAYAAGASAGAAAATTAPAATVATLPAGCDETITGGVVYKKCGTTYYRPYYHGPNVVYAVVTPP